MKILVTGGAGFIGSHIVDGLRAAGHSVAVIDDLSSGARDNLPAAVPLHVVDIVDAAAVQGVVATERPDAICHQAAQMSVSRSVREPLFDAQVNCIGLINVLDAAAAAGCRRFVFASSGGVLYGDVATPVPEDAPADPVSPYGITKWVGERYLRFYAAEHGMAAVALRYPTSTARARIPTVRRASSPSSRRSCWRARHPPSTATVAMSATMSTARTWPAQTSLR
jgi:UDP-glucose 4-epimerase